MKGSTGMLEQLKKALITGVGLAAKTWSEVEAAGKEAIRKAELPDSEAQRVLKSLKESYERTQDKLEGMVSQTVKDVLKKADIATRADVKDLWDEIRSLKKALKAVQAPKKAARPKAAAKPKTRPRARKPAA
jgi:polyhydroxyalkanoate synthesis regulator phasin